jgi:sucrose-6-phosphate hydrolase SacC (GH32 family)
MYHVLSSNTYVVRTRIFVFLLLSLFILPPPGASAKNFDNQQYQQLLEEAIISDLHNLDAAEYATLHQLFGLANGTRSQFLFGKLSHEDNIIYGTTKKMALNLVDLDTSEFANAMDLFLQEAATTKGGRAYLADLVPSIEMNAPEILPNTAHQLFLQRDEFAFTVKDGFSVHAIQQLDLAVANFSVHNFSFQAHKDKTRPDIFPAPLGGWNNDAYLVYGGPHNQDDIHIFYQHNPYAYSWNHMHWGHLVLEEDAEIDNRPVALEPRPEEGYYHNFSGSIASVKIPHPDNSGRLVTPAFFTATGTGEGGYVSFLDVPPTVMAVSGDPDLDNWEAQRYPLHDKNVYKDKLDSINNEWIDNRYDMRDPILIERDGNFFLMVAGTAVPGRKGEGVITLLKPSNPNNWAEPWVYVGDMFRHPISWADGGPGILETPNMIRIGNKEILFFGAQRRPSEGNLHGFNHHQGVEYYVGEFDSTRGAFIPDSTAGSNGYLEYGRSFYAINAVQRPEGDGGTYVGWIQGHDGRSDWHDIERGWNGITTFPRKIDLINGVPYIEPDERLVNLRKEQLITDRRYMVEDNCLKKLGIHERTLEIETTLDLEQAKTMRTVVLSNQNADIGVDIVYNGQQLMVDDEFIPISKTYQEELDVRIFIDRSVLVVWADGKSLSKTITPSMIDHRYTDQVILDSDGGTAVWRNFNAYKLDN